jgi:uncharacterized protein (TIGR02646 family)
VIKHDRPQAPAKFVANRERWQQQFSALRAQNATAAFQWYVVDGDSARDLILPVLKQMTAEHCSYCDAYSSYEVGETIDHFRPVSSFHEIAYAWDNLFLACNNCQKRGDAFDDRLLKPDAGDYAFEKYFVFNYATGDLAPAPEASADERARAERTIALFDLNHAERSKSRRTIFLKLTRGDIDDAPQRAYRFVTAAPATILPPDR